MGIWGTSISDTGNSMCSGTELRAASREQGRRYPRASGAFPGDPSRTHLRILTRTFNSSSTYGPPLPGGVFLPALPSFAVSSSMCVSSPSSCVRPCVSSVVFCVAASQVQFPFRWPGDFQGKFREGSLPPAPSQSQPRGHCLLHSKRSRGRPVCR